MNTNQKSLFQTIMLFILLAIITCGPATAKSLYVITNINASPTPIAAYNINTDGTLTYQATYSVPSYAGGAVGLAIDTDSQFLFVTYEGSNVIQLVDATTMTGAGSTTALGAYNLAGIVVDQHKQKVYTVDRETNKLYVYSWNKLSKTLTLDGGTYRTLPGVSMANGIALDEVKDLLYVGDRSTTTVRYFKTADWTLAGSFTVCQSAMGIAVDAKNGFVYTGNAYPGYGSSGLLCKYDLNTNIGTSISVRAINSSNNVVGLAVDTGLGGTDNLYITTGNQGSGGTDQLIGYTPSLTSIWESGYLGNPTGLAIPSKEVSYNPLNLTKDDGGACFASGTNVSYDICFDNTKNTKIVADVKITDMLPATTNASFVSATGSYTYDPIANKVVWDVGDLAAGAPKQCVKLVLKVNAAAGITFSNAATITSQSTPPTTTSDTTDVCKQVNICDVNKDSRVNILDINLITAARGTSNILYDIDKDGWVSTNDARICVLKCDKARCAQ